MPLPPKMAPANRPMMGILAPQGMKVVVMMVMRRSRSFSMVREAMTPGTPQPDADEHGDEALAGQAELAEDTVHERRRHGPYSRTSSRKASIRNSTSIWGTKPSTAPTPATMPSRIRPLQPIGAPARLQTASADQNRHAGDPHAVVGGIGGVKAVLVRGSHGVHIGDTHGAVLVGTLGDGVVVGGHGR